MDLLSNNLLNLKQRNDRLVEEKNRNKEKMILLNKMNSALIELKKLNDSMICKFDPQMRAKFLDRNYRMDSMKWSKEYENAKLMFQNCNNIDIYAIESGNSSQTLKVSKTEPTLTSNTSSLKRKTCDSKISEKLEKRVKCVNPSDIIFDTLEKYQNKKRRTENDRKFICDYRDCGEKLFTQYALKVHKRKHEESKPIRYKCLEISCFESFLSPEQLRRHQISKHNMLVNKFVCLYCGQRFRNKNRLKTHERDQHFGCHFPEEPKESKQTEKTNTFSITKSEEITFPGLKLKKRNLLLDKKRLKISLP